MAKFKEWYEKNLTVGAFPIKVNTNILPFMYDVIINVSDEFYPDVENKLHLHGCKTYWFPMNECKRDVGLNSIYGAMVILHEAEMQNKTVYLYCHAGPNRSPTVKAAYHYMRTGEHIKEERGGYLNRLLANCGRGYLPPKAEMESFLSAVQKRITKGMDGGTLDMCKIGIINNF